MSRGKFIVTSTVYPREPGYGYPPAVPQKMTYYSPGAKKPRETWDEYYYRRTVGLMEFVRDAIRAAAAHPSSPFALLRQDPATGILYAKDSANATHETRAAILLIHAGASYWTDGGEAGYFGQDTPSDMIDAFISRDFFDYFSDTLKFDTLRMGDGTSLHRGILVNNGSVLLDEIMMVSETSNQDSLNWGIHGIMVNQIARQIGIPDLHSNQSEVGSFCIMDIAGYSAGRGFIPPWPSAWVRAFMGWDTPVVVDVGAMPVSYNLRAVGGAKDGDTTILLVPINDHEYYLIENRQRNLSASRDVFNYDTTDNREHIDPYDPVNIAKNAAALGDSKVIDSVRNYDVSIPASGVLVWHVDEHLVRDRLAYNVLNADSLYGAVKLVEADGINDLGIMFMDIFYQAAFDYGGAEDVFPHTTIGKTGGDVTVSSFGPFTRPSTQSNDGGHTYLVIDVEKTGKIAPGAPLEEVYAIRDYFVVNTPDSVFRVTVRRDDPAPGIDGWPKRALPSKFFEPAICNVYDNGDSLEIAALDTAGRLYIWPAQGSGYASMGSERDSIIVLSLQGDSATVRDIVYNADSSDTQFVTRPVFRPVTYLRKIDRPVSFPTSVGDYLFIPSAAGKMYVLKRIVHPDSSQTAQWDSIALPAPPSCYVCNYAASDWAVGCSDGSVVFGSALAVTHVVAADSLRRSPVDAIAAVQQSSATIAVVHRNGRLALLRRSAPRALSTATTQGGIGPYTLAAGPLYASEGEAADVVVCDVKQGLWMFTTTGDALKTAPQWKNTPNDWAGTYHYVEKGNDENDRRLLPSNGSPPSLADIDADGSLDIIVGGSNGVFAFNRKGVLLDGWPAELDKRYWYQRGSVMSAPLVGMAPGGADPRIVFSSPTGQNVTFAVARIDSAPANTGKIFYSYNTGIIDSIGGLSQSLIDTLLVFGDSIILPFITPGGYIDALNTAGRRPDTVRTLPHIGTVRQSYWPLSTGGVATSPILCDLDGDSAVDIIAVSQTGAVYRFELNANVLSPVVVWPQAGFSSSRTFAYLGPAPSSGPAVSSRIDYFYNYPNPTAGLDKTVFRYRFSGPASDIRLDIFTYTGYHAYSSGNLPSVFPGADEHEIALAKFGPGVYRCRLEAKVNGTKQVKYWKMAVVK